MFDKDRPKCGELVDDYKRYCPNCGYDFDGDDLFDLDNIQFD